MGSNEKLQLTLFPSLVLIKACLGVQPGSFCPQTGTAEGTTGCGSLIAPNSHKQDQSLCRSIRDIETNTKKQPKWEDKEIPQMKEQENSPKEELDEKEASNLSYRV